MNIYRFGFRDPRADNPNGTIIVWGYEESQALEDAMEHLAMCNREELKLTLREVTDTTKSAIIFSNVEAG